MVLAGLERPDTGSIMVAGEDLRALDEDALARFRGRNVGIVFQSFHLIPTMTALENVAVPLELAGAADAHRARARRSSPRSAWPSGCDHYPAQLSGGEQQRVALARALAPQSGDPGRRRADRQSRRGHRPADRSNCCSPATTSAAPRWCW